LFPVAFAYELLVEFDGNAIRWQLQPGEHFGNRLMRRYLTPFPIHRYLHEHLLPFHNSPGAIIEATRLLIWYFSAMPTTYSDTWLPVLIQIVIAIGVAGAMIGLSAVLGRRVKDSVKSSPYESGMKPVGNARERFSVKFYLVAMVFILFDIEAIFLYPWAVIYRQLKLFAFFEMLLFIVLVLCGFFYIWKKGVLNWSTDEEKTVARRENVRAA